MLKGLRVPTHRIDVPGLFVFEWDDAWDKARIAKTDRIVLVPISEAMSRANALLNGHVDVIEPDAPG